MTIIANNATICNTDMRYIAYRKIRALITERTAPQYTEADAWEGEDILYKEWKCVYGMDVLEATSAEKSRLPEMFGYEAAKAARSFHREIPEYSETPLVSLPARAKKLGVKGIYVKDESKRFSLNAFKGLGGSYAMFRILCERLGLDPTATALQELRKPEYRDRVREAVFVTATDGNHGRGVSWAGGIFGCQVHVYMPAGSVEARAQAIRRVGPAEVTITDMNYDDTVRYAKEQSEKNGWYLIQDTAWDGYEKIPSWIIQGYLTMALEALEQLEKQNCKPTHVFLQAGVGAMAGGVLGFLANSLGADKPVTAIVEPRAANCIFRSAEKADGKAYSVEGGPVTIMAGLNCGTPCKITWPVLRDYAEFYFSCPDYVAAHGMRTYAKTQGDDEAVLSGESGAATMGALELVLSQKELEGVKEAMGLTEDSEILLFNTEGDTDPDGYRKIVEDGAYPLPAIK